MNAPPSGEMAALCVARQHSRCNKATNTSTRGNGTGEQFGGLNISGRDRGEGHLGHQDQRPHQARRTERSGRCAFWSEGLLAMPGGLGDWATYAVIGLFSLLPFLCWHRMDSVLNDSVCRNICVCSQRGVNVDLLNLGSGEVACGDLLCLAGSCDPCFC
jgi:hypothetical protein